MVRFGKTRYGHVFSKGKAATGWVGHGSWRGRGLRLPPGQAELAPPMPHPDSRPAVQVERALIPLRVWEVIDNGMRLKISCDNCQHETLWTQGYMEKKLKRWRAQTVFRMAQSLRCGGCRSNYIRVRKG